MSVSLPVEEQKQILTNKIDLLLGLPQADFCRKLMCVVPPLVADGNLRFQEYGPNVIFLLAGTQRTVFTDRNGSREYIQQPGEVLYLDRGIHYTTFWDTACQRLGIAMSHEGFFASWNDNPGQGRYVREPDIYYGESHLERSDYPDLFAALGARARQYELTDEVSCMLPRLLLNIVREMLSDTPRQPAVDQLFKRISAYIDHNYMNTLNGKMLAEKFAIGEARVSRMFRRYSGAGIGEYIRAVRMEQAYRMLYDRGCTVAETASACGFADPSYFVKVFQRYWRLRPGELRSHQGDGSSATPVIDFYKASDAQQ